MAISLQGGSNTKPFFVYNSHQVGTMHATPSSGVAEGNYQLQLTVTPSLAAVLSIAEVNKNNLKCKFGLAVTKASVLNGLSVVCLAPAHRAEHVGVSLSVDNEQTWLDSNASFTFLCEPFQHLRGRGSDSARFLLRASSLGS